MRYASAAEAAAHPGIGTAVATVCVSSSNSSTSWHMHSRRHDKAGAALID